MDLGQSLTGYSDKQESRVHISRIIPSAQGKGYREMDINPMGFKVVSKSGEQKETEKSIQLELQQLNARCKDLENKLKSQKSDFENQLHKKYEEGLQEGKKIGIEEGKVQSEATTNLKIAEIQEEWNLYIQGVEDQKNSWTQEFEKESLQLFQECLKHLMGETAKILPESMGELVVEAIRELGTVKKLVIRSHPHHLKALAAPGQGLYMAINHQIKSVEFEEDTRLPLGAVEVSSESTLATANYEEILKQFSLRLQECFTQKWAAR